MIFPSGSTFGEAKDLIIANAPNPSTEATDEMWVFLKKLNAGDVLHGNMPYVYKPKQAVTDYEFTTLNTTMKAKNTGVIAKSETLEDVYSFYATYENTTATAGDPFYYVSIDGDICLGNNGSLTVGPYRWIIRKTSKFGNETNYAREMHFFDGEEVGETTGVISNGQLTIDNETGSWYTLDGRQLDGKPNTKGVYINNGIKVVVK